MKNIREFQTFFVSLVLTFLKVSFIPYSMRVFVSACLILSVNSLPCNSQMISSINLLKSYAWLSMLLILSIMKCIEILANDTKLLYPVIMPCFFTENLLVRVLNYNAV